MGSPSSNRVIPSFERYESVVVCFTLDLHDSRVIGDGGYVGRYRTGDAQVAPVLKVGGGGF